MATLFHALIKMKEADQEKTSFITSQGLFCYKVMPFGLKNAGATYLRLVNHMYLHRLGETLKCTWTTCWSKVRGRRSIWMTVKKPLIHLGDIRWSWIQDNVPLELHQGNSLVLWFHKEGLKQTLIKSKRFWTWSPRRISRTSRASLDK